MSDYESVAISIDGNVSAEAIADRLVVFVGADEVRIFPWAESDDFYTLEALLRAQTLVEKMDAAKIERTRGVWPSRPEVEPDAGEVARHRRADVDSRTLATNPEGTP